jgi:hypothetical protein
MGRFDWLLFTDFQKNCAVIATTEATHRKKGVTSQNSLIFEQGGFEFNEYLLNIYCQEMLRKVSFTDRTHIDVAVLIVSVKFPLAPL